MHKDTQMKPCHFCGRSDSTIVKKASGSGQVECVSCGARGPLEIPSLALGAWNKSMPAPKLSLTCTRCCKPVVTDSTAAVIYCSLDCAD